jgi:hypothetical protein
MTFKRQSLNGALNVCRGCAFSANSAGASVFRRGGCALIDNVRGAPVKDWRQL